MARRSKNWNEGLAQDLRNKAFAKEFILSSAAEGIPLQQVLAKIIKAYGVKEFSEKTGIAAPNLLRISNPKHNPTMATLDKILKPFGLRISVTNLGRQKALAA